MIKKKIRVLVVDDSPIARDIISEGLSLDSGIEVVGTAMDAYSARDKIIQLQPDVLTLDIEMPKMDGVQFLRHLMPQYPLPVIIVSSFSQRGKQVTLDALEAGAIDFIHKPSSNVNRGLISMVLELRTKIKIASSANVSYWKARRNDFFSVYKGVKINSQSEIRNKIIAIGASTGGTEAIRKVLSTFPENMPGVVIVQHMPADFTRLFAESLNRTCRMEVREAKNDDRIISGRVLVAPGDLQLTVVRIGEIYKVMCRPGEKVNGHCPSIDVFMNSVAKSAGSDSYGILLTGMGKDGARGMKAMKEAGAVNIAQDEESSVVFGMPKAAYEIGAVDKLLPLDRIGDQLINHINSTRC
jgi:two-component system chemotaxis response regulator CheB